MAAEFFIECLQLLVDVVALPSQFAQRHGIRQIFGPAAFVYIQANPYDAVVYEIPLEDVLDENAADLLVFDPDVVRPFDARTNPSCGQIAEQRKGGYASKVESFACRKVFRVEDDGESEVLSRSGILSVSTLSATGTLFNRGYD